MRIWNLGRMIGPFNEFGSALSRTLIQVHESSHHEFAYTDDVYSCGRSRYFWLRADGLLGLSGFVVLQNRGRKDSRHAQNQHVTTSKNRFKGNMHHIYLCHILENF